MSFFKDFKDDLSQAVNELMPETNNAPAKEIPQMVDTISATDTPVGQDTISSLLNSLDSVSAPAAAPSATPMFEEIPVAAIEPEVAPIPEPVFIPEPVVVPEPEPVFIPEPVVVPEPAPVFVAEPEVAPAPEPISIPEPEPAPAPVFAEEPVSIPVYTETPAPAPKKTPVEPVFAPEPERVEVPKAPVEPVFAPEPEREEAPKAPVSPVFAPSTEERPAPINTINNGSNEVGIIPRGMTIVGDITSNGSLTIEGSVKGNITIDGKLNVSGCIEGDASADEVFADGAKIVGEIKTEGSVKIGKSTVIKGNITASSAVLAGAVKGDIDVNGPVILDSTAIIMGNIKSKSIQINNGAAIEGLCSQCYAEVSPTSFFKDE